jgi:phosphoribosyl-dephospho-CoA transferase
VDCQIETDDGAIALGELLSGAPEVLVRTPTGPRLISAPWSDAA